MKISEDDAGRAPANALSARKDRGYPAKIIAQMMFVSGETAEASQETTTIIEEIVHTQVVEMVIPTSRTSLIYPSSLPICSLKGRPY